MDFATDLHLMLDDEPATVRARQHPDQPETYFIDLGVYRHGQRAHLCLSGTATQLGELLTGMRDALLDAWKQATPQTPGDPQATDEPQQASQQPSNHDDEPARADV